MRKVKEIKELCTGVLEYVEHIILPIAAAIMPFELFEPHLLQQPMQEKLSPRQQQLLDYLRDFIGNHGDAPSLRRAAADLDISHAAVAQLLIALEKKGHIKRQDRYSRTIHLLNRAGQPASVHRLREVPIIGKVRAGLPMYAQQEYEESVMVDGQLFAGRNLFALRIKGNSMQDAGILEGDLVICEPRQYAENGEIVVALIAGEEATVKRFFLHEDRIELRPANAEFSPVFYSLGEILIQGKVVGVIRNFLQKPSQKDNIPKKH
ncbi:MAG: transcriptional repressor LexA [Deltaproteobacteria bacterium]